MVYQTRIFYQKKKPRARRQLLAHIPHTCVSFDYVIPKLDLAFVYRRIALQNLGPLSSKVGRWLGRRALSSHICLFVHSNQPQILKKDDT